MVRAPATRTDPGSCIVLWSGKVLENNVSDAIFSTIDFPPTFANLAGLRVPDDRVIDGVDQTELLFGKSVEGAPNTFFYWSDHDHPIRGGNGIR